MLALRNIRPMRAAATLRSRWGALRCFSSESVDNLSCILESRPGVGNSVSIDNFSYSSNKRSLDVSQPGHVLLKTEYLSVDPYMRCMFDEGHPQLGSYQEPFKLHQPLHGGGVGRVVSSDNADFAEDDLVVVPFMGYEWSEYVELDPTRPELNAYRVENQLIRGHPSLALGALGMVGATAYIGLFKAGEPKESDTVVVSGAAGAVGSLVGQLARAKARCKHVVGICGGPEKCEAAKNIGFDVGAFDTFAQLWNAYSTCARLNLLVDVVVSPASFLYYVQLWITKTRISSQTF